MPQQQVPCTTAQLTPAQAAVAMQDFQYRDCCSHPEPSISSRRTTVRLHWRYDDADRYTKRWPGHLYDPVAIQPTGTSDWTNINGTGTIRPNTHGHHVLSGNLLLNGRRLQCYNLQRCTTVMVIPDPSISIDPTSATACVGGFVELTATTQNGTGTCTIQWQSSATGVGGWTNISGANGATYNPPTATSGSRFYRATYSCTGSGCGNATSNIALVVIIVDPSISINPPSNTVCVGGDLTMLATVNGGAGTCTVQWQSSTTGSRRLGGHQWRKCHFVRPACCYTGNDLLSRYLYLYRQRLRCSHFQRFNGYG